MAKKVKNENSSSVVTDIALEINRELKLEELPGSEDVNYLGRLIRILMPNVPKLCAAYIKDIQDSLGEVPVTEVGDLVEIIDERALSISIQYKMEKRKSYVSKSKERLKKIFPVAKKTPAKKATMKGEM